MRAGVLKNHLLSNSNRLPRMGLQVSVAVVLRPTVPLGVSSEDAVPPRALASATISFGLVSIPVKLYPAGESADRFAFHWLHAKCGTRLRIQYFCPKDDEVVPRKEMVKGYEVSKGRYVTFTA